LKVAKAGHGRSRKHASPAGAIAGLPTRTAVAMATDQRRNRTVFEPLLGSAWRSRACAFLAALLLFKCTKAPHERLRKRCIAPCIGLTSSDPLAGVPEAAVANTCQKK